MIGCAHEKPGISVAKPVMIVFQRAHFLHTIFSTSSQLLRKLSPIIKR
jgi:uncharacterized ion transporter superfamily protein YfcC